MRLKDQLPGGQVRVSQQEVGRWDGGGVELRSRVSDACLTQRVQACARLKQAPFQPKMPPNDENRTSNGQQRCLTVAKYYYGYGSHNVIRS